MREGAISLDDVAPSEGSRSIIQYHGFSMSSPNTVILSALISPPPVLNKHAIEVLSSCALPIRHPGISVSYIHLKLRRNKLRFDQLSSPKTVSE